jgi:hypothetical protein
MHPTTMAEWQAAEKINHAFYDFEKNHHVPLYKFSAEIVKKVIEDKLKQVHSRTLIIS